MENQNFVLKVSRLFPSSFSSCHFRTLHDVADNSVTIPRTQNKIPNVSDPSHFPPKTKTIPRKLLMCNSLGTEGRKCPPVTPMSTLNNPKAAKKDKPLVQKCTNKNAVNSKISINQSSSSNSGWFSSDDGKADTFFSLSSTSLSRRFKKCEEMKSIDESGRRSFSSVTSYDTVLTKCSRKTYPKATYNRKAIKQTEKCSSKLHDDHQLSFDHLSTQLYYSKKTTSQTRRNTKKNRSRKRVHNMIEESYAVEKRSRDPRSDFRASMVEMIVEKHMFGAHDLENLLGCFLSLNSASYHGIIFDVFTEICDTLFTN